MVGQLWVSPAMGCSQIESGFNIVWTKYTHPPRQPDIQFNSITLRRGWRNLAIDLESAVRYESNPKLCVCFLAHMAARAIHCPSNQAMSGAPARSAHSPRNAPCIARVCLDAARHRDALVAMGAAQLGSAPRPTSLTPKRAQVTDMTSTQADNVGSGGAWL